MTLEHQINAFLKANTSGWSNRQLNAACAYMFRHASLFTTRAGRADFVLSQDREWQLIWNEATRVAGITPTVSIAVH